MGKSLTWLQCCNFSNLFIVMVTEVRLLILICFHAFKFSVIHHFTNWGLNLDYTVLDTKHCDFSITNINETVKISTQNMQ